MTVRHSEEDNVLTVKTIKELSHSTVLKTPSVMLMTAIEIHRSSCKPVDAKPAKLVPNQTPPYTEPAKPLVEEAKHRPSAAALNSESTDNANHVTMVSSQTKTVTDAFKPHKDWPTKSETHATDGATAQLVLHQAMTDFHVLTTKHHKDQAANATKLL